jgi:hypothetical protein
MKEFEVFFSTKVYYEEINFGLLTYYKINKYRYCKKLESSHYF